MGSDECNASVKIENQRISWLPDKACLIASQVSLYDIREFTLKLINY